MLPAAAPPEAPSEPKLGSTQAGGLTPAGPGAASTGTWRELWRGWLEVGRLGLVALFAYAVLFNLSVVRGSSMAPGIHDGDRILVEPWSYLFSSARRGDVVVLSYPLDPKVDYIKRVIGLPGDEIVIAAGRVWVNGAPLREPYVAYPDRGDFQRVIVRDGHYFVMGDNRPKSSDSREFGQVPADHLRGRVDLRLWPPARIGLID